VVHDVSPCVVAFVVAGEKTVSSSSSATRLQPRRYRRSLEILKLK
jgi:hypothetical protein